MMVDGGGSGGSNGGSASGVAAVTLMYVSSSC